MDFLFVSSQASFVNEISGKSDLQFLFTGPLALKLKDYTHMLTVT